MPLIAASDLPVILRLFGDALIYIATPILIVSIASDLLRDWFRDDSKPLPLPCRDDATLPVSTYLSSRAIDRRQGSRKPR